MALRCLLFSSDEATADRYSPGAGWSRCWTPSTAPSPSPAIDKATHGSFQIVIIDWDQQPKPDCCSRPPASAKPPNGRSLWRLSAMMSVFRRHLQAGANSILRKPILERQVQDTLTTARDLLRSKQESAAASAMAAAAGAVPRFGAYNSQQRGTRRRREDPARRRVPPVPQHRSWWTVRDRLG